MRLNSKLRNDHQTVQANSRWQEPAENDTLLEVQNLECAYTFSNSRLLFFRAVPKVVVHGVSFAIGPRETLALVGESGSGKSTIARAINGLLTPVRGRMFFEGQDITKPVEQRSKALRRHIQLIFQNPDASLNRRHRVGYLIGRPLQLFYGLTGKAQRRRTEQLLNDVQLDGSYIERFPAQLSGGERQRVAIARALAAEPKLLLCDEILSALDVSVQANILDLLRILQAEFGIAYLFISHDLAVVRWLAHRVGVLYQGQFCEIGRVEDVFGPPFHPYTEMLLRAVPKPVPGSLRMVEVMSEPSLETPVRPRGCPFATRCPYKIGSICHEELPPWQTTGDQHSIRCHIPIAELSRLQSQSSDNSL